MDTKCTHTHDQDRVCIGCYNETLKAFERARLERKYKALKIRRFLM